MKLDTPVCFCCILACVAVIEAIRVELVPQTATASPQPSEAQKRYLVVAHKWDPSVHQSAPFPRGYPHTMNLPKPKNYSAVSADSSADSAINNGGPFDERRGFAPEVGRPDLPLDCPTWSNDFKLVSEMSSKMMLKGQYETAGHCARLAMKIRMKKNILSALHETGRTDWRHYKNTPVDFFDPDSMKKLLFNDTHEDAESKKEFEEFQPPASWAKMKAPPAERFHAKRISAEQRALKLARQSKWALQYWPSHRARELAKMNYLDQLSQQKMWQDAENS